MVKGPKYSFTGFFSVYTCRRHLVVPQRREHLGELLQAEVVARGHHPRRRGVGGRRWARRLAVVVVVAVGLSTGGGAESASGTDHLASSACGVSGCRSAAATEEGGGEGGWGSSIGAGSASAAAAPIAATASSPEGAWAAAGVKKGSRTRSDWRFSSDSMRFWCMDGAVSKRAVAVIVDGERWWWAWPWPWWRR